MVQIGVIASAWGPRFGGINAFNHDLTCALARTLPNQVVCFVPNATEEEISYAADMGVILTSLAPGDERGPLSTARAYEIAHLSQLANPIDWWIGHDVITGPLAVLTAKLTSARSAVIQHTDYSSYAALKGADPVRILAREGEEKNTLAAADLVLAVGPKLASAARDRVGLVENPPRIVELIPGLPVIPRNIHAPRTFRAVTLGRLDPESDRIKQAKLAVTSFGRLIDEIGDALGPDPRITVIGLDALTGARTAKKTEQQTLMSLAAKEAGRSVNVLGHPYTESRDQLHAVLADSSVCLMLSLHEGFGLAGWEAIAADVPLIVSRNSGLYDFLARIGGPALGCVHAVDIRGPITSDVHNKRDVATVTAALRVIALEPNAAKGSARDLRRMLEKYTWTGAAERILEAMGVNSVTTKASQESDMPSWLDLPRTNLPTAPDRFIGQTDALSRIASILPSSKSRLFTVVGPPGAGSTRFALELANRLLPAFREHIYYVDLANVSDPNLVVSSVLKVLNVDARDPIIDALQQLFAGLPTLIVLDGFEHLVEASGAVGAVLASVPTLRFLVTSREPLHIYDETEVSLEPLTSPEATELFILRAGIELPEDQVSMVSTLCNRVDNLPLAIELLAPHAHHFTPEALLEALEESTGDVASKRRDIPARHRSLRATIEWSHRLLSADEERLFRRFSVFHNGATLEAITSVANFEKLPGFGMLELIESLIDRRLLRTEGEGQGRRFSMLQTIREYATETLASDAAEARKAKQIHAAFYLAFAQKLANPLSGPVDEEAWTTLDQEQDNLDAAAVFFGVAQCWSESLTLGAVLGALWWSRDCVRGEERLLVLDPGIDAEVTLREYCVFQRWRARIYLRLAKVGEAENVLTYARQMASTGEFEDLDADLLADLALIHIERCEWTVALGLLKEALDKHQRQGGPPGLADVLDSLGIVAIERGQSDDASNYLASALLMYEKLHVVVNAAWVHADLAHLSLMTGSIEMARDQALTAKAMGERAGDRFVVCWANVYLGLALSFVGKTERYAESKVVLSDAIIQAKLLGDQRLLIFAVESRAVGMGRGDELRVISVLSGTSAARERLNIPITPTESERVNRRLESLRNELGEVAFDGAWLSGGSLTLTDVAETARSD